MENGEIRDFLERIAIALERIAHSGEIADSLASQNDFKKNFAPGTAFADDIPLQIEEAESLEDVETLDEPEEEDIIETFLASKNIEIKVLPPEDAADHVINSLADFLGSHYSALSELLSKIKRSMQRGGFITLSMTGYSQKDVSDVCQFCTRLHEIAFLEQYKYFKSPQYLLRAKTTTLPSAQNFFSGKWLERFVLQTVQKSVDIVSVEIGRELDFSYVINPQIILPNGNDFELDVIFHVNGSFYWIEVKTGDYQQHVSKYSRMSKMMGLDYEHSIMVLTDIQPDKSEALTSLFSMAVYGLSHLESKLIETIKKDVNA